MKVLIDIPKEVLEHPHNYCCYTLANQIKGNYAPIPDNATNGDVLKVVFPNMERKHDVSFGGFMESNWIECNGIDITDNDWWDAPYKGGNEEWIEKLFMINYQK